MTTGIQITLDTTVKVTAQQVASAMESELVILNMTSGTYYSLNAVGAAVWQMIQAPIRASAICDAVQAEYEVERAQVEQDIIALLSDLAANGLIEVVDASGADVPATPLV